MSIRLTLSLIVFAVIWMLIILYYVRHKKISVKYSLFWIIASLIILVVGLCPWLLYFVNELFGFEVISNLVIGILITILMLITFILTIIVTKQKEQIRLLIQEVSILKQKEE